MNTRSAVRQALRLITHHIGLGGDAHPDVTNLSSGFMSPELLRQHNTVFKQRTAIQDPNGTDILKLPIGYYSGSKFTNHPASANPTDINSAHAYVSVIPSSQDARRMIFLVEAQTGRIWTRTVNDTYETNNTWSKVDHYVRLWSGNSDLSSPVTLTKPILDVSGYKIFTDVKVKFVTSSNHTDEQSVSSKSSSINSTNIIDGDKKSIVTYEANLSFNTEDGVTTAVTTSNLAVHIYPNSTNEHDARIETWDTEPGIKITEIRGYY